MKIHFLLKSYLISLLFICYMGSLQAQDGSCKCCSNAHKAFDFWQGNWEAFNPDGKLAGTNIIDKIQDNCILRENWKSANGTYTGTSYNFYNTSTGQWEQIWIDNQGQQLHLKGGLVNGRMILQGEPQQQADGSLLINRITWTPLKDGMVRQHWEVKKGKADWVTAFDGLYKPVIQEEE